MKNMELWNAVSMTDPKAVKPITGKSYQGNSPKPYWLIEQATKHFGPVGFGWGVTVKSERFERLSETDVLHVAVVSVWYLQDGKRSETFDQMGGTKAAYWVKGKSKDDPGRMMVDEDAGKKSVTDGMVKCLSMIGFAGDIFSGRWDDSKYVAEANAYFREEERPKGMAPERLAEWLDVVSRAGPDELRSMRDDGCNAAKEVNDGDAYQAIRAAAIKRAAQLTEAQPA